MSLLFVVASSRRSGTCSWSQRERTVEGNKGEVHLEEVRGSRNASKQTFRES